MPKSTSRLTSSSASPIGAALSDDADEMTRRELLWPEVEIDYEFGEEGTLGDRNLGALWRIALLGLSLSRVHIHIQWREAQG